MLVIVAECTESIRDALLRGPAELLRPRQLPAAAQAGEAGDPQLQLARASLAGGGVRGGGGGGSGAPSAAISRAVAAANRS